jgi:hypothetical protein
MKKLVTVIACLFIVNQLFSQVFNTACTLKRGTFSLGLNPAYYNDNLGLFLHGNAGLVSGVDLALKYGFLDGPDYIGADIEWAVLKGKPDVSITTGAHSRDYFGLDLAANLSFPLKDGISLYTGADTDLVFNNDVDLLLWIPVGIEIDIRKQMSFLFEAEIPVNNIAFAVIDGGIMFYFR